MQSFKPLFTLTILATTSCAHDIVCSFSEEPNRINVGPAVALPQPDREAAEAAKKEKVEGLLKEFVRLMQAGKLEEARKVADQVKEIDPEDPRATAPATVFSGRKMDRPWNKNDTPSASTTGDTDWTPIVDPK